MHYNVLPGNNSYTAVFQHQQLLIPLTGHYHNFADTVGKSHAGMVQSQHKEALAHPHFMLLSSLPF